MARALIVGCGCRGTALGRELIATGWQVRGTSRWAAGGERIGAAGIEPAQADPDRVGTVLDHVGDVTVLVYLMGTAAGESAAAVHGPRLERILEKLVDTPVRGFVYEAAGPVPDDLLSAGREQVEAAAERWRIPVAFVRSDPGLHETWLGEARDSVLALVG